MPLARLGGTQENEVPTPKISFKDVANNVVDPGEYLCNFTGQKYEEASQSSGKPYIRADFTVRHLASDETDVKFAGRKLFRNFSLQPQSLFALKGLMVALDCDPDIFEEEDLDITEALGELIGGECVVTVTNEEYQGEPRARVGRIRAASGF